MNDFIDKIVNNEWKVKKCSLVIDKKSNLYSLEPDDGYSILLAKNDTIHLKISLCEKLDEVKNELYVVSEIAYMLLLELLVSELDSKEEFINSNVVDIRESAQLWIVTRKFIEMAVFYRYRCLFINSKWKLRLLKSSKDDEMKWYPRLKFWKKCI